MGATSRCLTPGTMQGWSPARAGSHGPPEPSRRCSLLPAFPPRSPRSPPAVSRSQVPAFTAAMNAPSSARSTRRLHPGDIPRLDQPLPRALTTDHDRDLMAAIVRTARSVRRHGLVVLRGTAIGLGELLDKLGTERTVPLDQSTLAAMDGWTSGPANAAGTARCHSHSTASPLPSCSSSEAGGRRPTGCARD